MVLAPTSKRPWKITVIAYPDARLSLPDVLPHGLAHSAYIQFDFKFPRESDDVFDLLESWSRLSLFDQMAQSCAIRIPRLKASNRVQRGIDEICRRLAEVPVKRDITICWSDCSTITKSIKVKTVLRPFSRFWSLGTFRFGKVIWQEEEELAIFIKTITARNPKYGIMRCE